MPGLRPPAKPELPETPFGHSSIPQTGSGQQRAAPNRFTNRDSERWYRQPPIMEDQEQQQQDANKVLQNFSSRDSERLPRDRDLGSRSQLGSRESVRTGEFPSKGSTRASSANSRCPFLPCPSCVESCLETQDDQQHYRPSWAYMTLVLVILLAIVVLSFVPLAGSSGGWAQFAMNNITTDVMVQLGLAPWDHYVDVGYIKYTNAMRAYSAAHNWQVNGMTYHKYARLWDNVRYGNEAQLLGGYAAGWLVLSALTALVYLGFWLRCMLHLFRLEKGEKKAMEEPNEAEVPISLDQWTLRPLGAWLWPVALVHTVVLVALLTAFLLVVQASNDYQCLHVAPGIDCLVHPGWALWCAYGAMFAWLALAILAIIEARKQRPARLERPNYATPSMAKTGSQQGSQQGGSQR
ncbi:g6029 [Coccomyxa viridis]|uniref:G6029 protein n=1 Tax=Coccomyxa viridis TaxID=1274662 RepID=A0ABP1FUD7_9CHLO